MANSITETVPKSTLAVAMLLWGVLFALGSWILVETVQNGKQLEQVNGLRKDVDDHELRIRMLERRP